MAIVRYFDKKKVKADHTADAEGVDDKQDKQDWVKVLRGFNERFANF